MKPSVLMIALFVVTSFAAPATRAAPAAAEFPWLDTLQVRALADPEGFRAELAVRFHLGEPDVQAILVDCPRPAEAYLVFRLSELSGRPPLVILERFKRDRGAGWGALAHSLGIKPGSDEFKALKRGHDLPGAPRESGPAAEKEHGPGKGHGKGKDKD